MEPKVQTGYALYGTDGDRHVDTCPSFVTVDSLRADVEHSKNPYTTIQEVLLLVIGDQAYFLQDSLPVILNSDIQADRKAKLAAARAKLTQEELELLLGKPKAKSASHSLRDPERA